MGRVLSILHFVIVQVPEDCTLTINVDTHQDKGGNVRPRVPPSYPR